MNRHRPLDSPSGSGSFGLARLGSTLLCAALLLSCAPSTNQTAAEEDTALVEPSQEDTRATEDADEPTVRPVSVELPGLPIGGADATFSASAPAQCVRVSWTAATLTDGVSVEIRGFGAPEQFTVSPTGCPPTPCLQGFRFTRSSTGCDVAVLWNGAPVDVDPSELTVTDAELTCADDSLCEQALAVIDAAGPATIGLFVDLDEVPEEEASSAGTETG